MKKRTVLFIPGFIILYFDYKLALIYLITVCVFLVINSKYNFVKNL